GELAREGGAEGIVDDQDHLAAVLDQADVDAGLDVAGADVRTRRLHDAIFVGGAGGDTGVGVSGGAAGQRVGCAPGRIRRGLTIDGVAGRNAVDVLRPAQRDLGGGRLNGGAHLH